jgi:hypothetical protein
MTEEEQKQQFLLELEFVNALANPSYINCKFTLYWLKR